MEQAVHTLAAVIDDFSALRRLSAFAALEQDIKAAVQQHGWDAV